MCTAASLYISPSPSSRAAARQGATQESAKIPYPYAPSHHPPASERKRPAEIQMSICIEYCTG
eukprot:scaffold38769_cov35-Tisochrysis_lutea.AAC.10